MNLTNNPIGGMMSPTNPAGMNFDWNQNRATNGMVNTSQPFNMNQVQNQSNAFTTFHPIPAQPQVQTLPCRVIAPGEEIQAKDVPIDTPSLFVANDGSYIIGKEWDSKGGIQDTIYIPAPKETQDSVPPVNSVEFAQIMERLNELGAMVKGLSDLSSVRSSRPNYIKQKRPRYPHEPNHYNGPKDKNPVESEVTES